MKIIQIIWCLLFLPLIISSGQQYNVATLDPLLIKDANAVVRFSEIIITVKDTGKVTFSEHRIITVLNKNGDRFGYLDDFTNKFNTLESIKGKVYNDNGILIRKLKSAEFIEQSATSEGTLFDDNRIMFCHPSLNKYPFTIEYEINENYNGVINYPSWYPQPGYDLAVEHSIYKVIIPNKLKIHFKKLNYLKDPEIVTAGDQTTYTFTLENATAIEKESLSPGINDIVPIVYSIPDYFKIDNHSGCNITWSKLGIWNYELNQQSNILSEKTISELEKIKNASKSNVEIIQKVYEYMQSHTRYVGIQLGIGGWKPFDASVVDKYGYGDCKGLTNYTKKLLSQIGIESIYTLAKAGNYSNDILYEDPFNQFNHVLLCVPNNNDTIWLECTSQIKPFGFEGSFTDDRHVLLISHDGGKIVKTITYTKDQNRQINKAEVDISSEGNLEGIISTIYTGLQYDDHDAILYASAEKQKEMLYDGLEIPNNTIVNFKFTNVRERIPSMQQNMNIKSVKYAAAMGNRLLMPLNLLNKQGAISNVMKPRKAHLKLTYAYFDTDTVIYHIPADYTVEFAPEPNVVTSEFGEYTSKAIINAEKSTITYIRSYTQQKGLFPPEKYKDYAKFKTDINKKDNIKVSLIIKT